MLGTKANPGVYFQARNNWQMQNTRTDVSEMNNYPNVLVASTMKEYFQKQNFWPGGHINLFEFLTTYFLVFHVS